MKSKSKLKFFLFSGILAAHKITASAPDTDLPTVAGMRVGFRICKMGSPIAGLCCIQNRVGVDKQLNLGQGESSPLPHVT